MLTRYKYYFRKHIWRHIQAVKWNVLTGYSRRRDQARFRKQTRQAILDGIAARKREQDNCEHVLTIIYAETERYLLCLRCQKQIRDYDRALYALVDKDVAACIAEAPNAPVFENEDKLYTMPMDELRKLADADVA